MAAGQGLGGGLPPVEPVQEQRHGLARMADDHPQLRIAVEHPGQDDRHGVQPDLVRIAGHRAVHGAPEVGALRQPGRRGRVDVDRLVGGFQRLPDRQVLRLVQVVALGVGVHHHTVQPQGLGALYFGHRALDVLRSDRGQAGEPVGMLAADLHQPVIGQRREIGPEVGAEDLDPRRGEEQELPVDAQRVHLAQPLLADLHQLVLQRAVVGEHGDHLQRRVVGGRRAVRQRHLGRQDLGDVPRLFRGDALVGDMSDLRRGRGGGFCARERAHTGRGPEAGLDQRTSAGRHRS